MKEKCSLFLLLLLVITPLATIAFLPAHVWVLLYIVLLTLVISISYSMECTNSACPLAVRVGGVVGCICCETLIWGCLCYLYMSPVLSQKALWQIGGGLFAAVGVGMGAVVAFGRVLQRIHEGE
ncbi:MAG: hypothetical protein MI749_17105 [Desulfovibrionales bacterium]|nr:hypothetical protein [Desulfovibrionales bacterium]